MLGQVKRLYGYRFFIASSIFNEFKSKFSRSRLGALWIIINPLVQSVVYATVLSSIIGSRLPGLSGAYAYSLYLLSGMLCWALFQEVIMGCVNVFVDKADLMKKVSFPRACLPIISSGVALVNNIFLLLAIIFVFLVMGHDFAFTAFWVPVVMLVNLAFALCVGTILGTLNVILRDVAQVVQVVLQALFWLTPIVYTVDILPSTVRSIVEVSPIYLLVSSYQSILVYGVVPDFNKLAVLFSSCMVLALFAMILFRRASSDISDAL